MKLSMKTLASKVAKLEGKKSQVKMGDVREILSILSELIYLDEYDQICNLLIINGKRRVNLKLSQEKKSK